MSSAAKLKTSPFRTTKTEYKFVYTLVLVGLASLTLATFFDPLVSQTVMNQNSIFGNIFQNYADQGANIVLIVAFEVLAWLAWQQMSDTFSRYLSTGALLGMAFNQILAALQDMLSYTFSMIHNLQHGIPMGVANNTAAVQNYPEPLRWSLAVVILVILSFAFQRWVSHRSFQEKNYLTLATLVGIATVFVATSTVGEMKLLWGRYRPYEMTDILHGSLGHFTPWYHLNGNTHHNSFPSGHTMSGWLFLYLTFFVPRSNYLWQKRLTIFGLAMGLLTALSRVRIGAHWLSDVTVSSLLVGLMVFIASRILQAHFVENQSINNH
ncbi:phosphatase PAP2 family protein [Convivina intestini]|uniref:phosphatase PAP2 family protein n=1 Tax=Convivina intestini TaxID=1505726 RepID=UPI00200FA8BF|nr:phosphatase PAP2 family protein [Convivina intestini]CAH1850984.1 hypothetical protein R078131_00202 [Convivina intestini]